MNAAAGVPWRPLAVITAVVLCAHGLALRGAPGTIRWPTALLPMAVRVHEAPAATPAPVPPAARPPSGNAPPVLERRPRAPAALPAQTARPLPAAAAAPPPPAVSIPAPASWRYAVTARWHGIPVSGDAQLAWAHDGASYEAVLVLDAPPQRRTQRSVGELGADGLQPVRFSDRVRSEEATHFDRAQGRITFSSNRPDVSLQTGAQDRLSVLLQLMALVSADPGRFVPGTTAALQVATTRDADTWAFTVEGLETLALPAGAVETMKLTRHPRSEYDTRLEVWLAPGPTYAPVRLRLTPPNADWLDMQWSGTDKR